MQLAGIFLVASCFLAFTTPKVLDKNRDQVSNEAVDPADKKPEELLTKFSTSIIYWDFEESEEYSPLEKAEMKEKVLNKLTQVFEDSKRCECQKHFENSVCASNGQLYANLCTFHCAFTEGESTGITPIMIFEKPDEEKSKDMCQLWYKLGGLWSPKGSQG